MRGMGGFAYDLSRGAVARLALRQLARFLLYMLDGLAFKDWRSRFGAFSLWF